MRDWISAPTIAIGVVFGLLAAPTVPYLSSVANAWYDELRPVITGYVRVIHVDEHHATISMRVEKHRECEYVRLVAYTIDADGVRRDATIRRVDGEESGKTRMVGEYDLGNWEIFPRLGGRMVRVESVHDCNGRQVRTILGQVELL